MSSYDAVVPISWGRLIEIVLPAWEDVLMRRRTLEAFCREFAPSEMHWFAPEVAKWHPVIEVSSTYLSEIQWTTRAPILPADNLRRSPEHIALTNSGGVEMSTLLLGRAIRTSASAELLGTDPFTDTDHYRYYGRMHDEPRYQVAGAKNGYHVLKSLFAITHDASCSLYRHVPKLDVRGPLLTLFEDLFLATRAFPGIHVLREPRAWPACDDPMVQGILQPREVQQLASYLPEIEARARGTEDELLPLFADRVRRAADQGLALVTLQEGL